jgi:2,4-dichlorophenol 6-monooxygenase
VPLGRFLLLAGPDGDAWIDALSSASGVPIEGRKLDRASMPDLDAWLSLAGIDRSGALLVRPDQHIAWRARCRAAHPARELSRALDVILSRSV